MTHPSHNCGKNAGEAIEEFLVQKPKNPLLVLIGPTASGKTALSINLSLHFLSKGYRLEVVNADSRQLYQGLDIGTAKIAAAEMRGVPHHLLSILPPTEPVSIAKFQALAQSAFQDIWSRGGVPFLVGGSMLYVSSLTDGLVPLPSDPQLRERLSALYDRDGGMHAHRLLAEKDPESAASIPIQNKTYLLRALEIVTMTNAPKSAALRHTPSDASVCIFGLDPPRDVLRRRIEERTTLMFDAGWVEEVRSLLRQGVPITAPAMQSHGYREIAAWIDAGENSATFPALKDAIVRATVRYAKRHRTWWKHDPRVHWCDATLAA